MGLEESKDKEIGRGAEAVITLFSNQSKVLKERLPKTYRHEKLDSELRRSRTRREVKILQKLQEFTPKVLFSDNESKIEMEYIKGKVAKEIIDSKPEIAFDIGKNAAAMHDLNIMHGDLTTSNIILNEQGKIKFIDFGLSQVTHKVEDKAVDLHLFLEALESKHYKQKENIWKEFLKGYNPKNKAEILKRLEIVEKRGRNKEKY